MAVLTEESDQYEVRMKRFPEGTYFDEYVKTGERDKPTATECDRYIIGESGVKYTIEVTLRKGFNFGKFSQIRVMLFFPGSKSSISFIDIFKPSHDEPESSADIIAEL
jgi:hypothetical protein